MRDKACHPHSEVSHNEVPQAWPELYSFFSSISLSLCLSLSHTHTAHSLSLSLTHTHTHTHTHRDDTPSMPLCPAGLCQGLVTGHRALSSSLRRCPVVSPGLSLPEGSQGCPARGGLWEGGLFSLQPHFTCSNALVFQGNTPPQVFPLSP